jgi:hypothetical protein
MTKITWHHKYEEAQLREFGGSPPVHTFVLDVTKSWKGVAITGRDVAEMIAEDYWSAEAIAIRAVTITGPKTYAGDYQIVVVWEPTFKATKDQPATTVAPKAEKIF